LAYHAPGPFFVFFFRCPGFVPSCIKGSLKQSLWQLLCKKQLICDMQRRAGRQSTDGAPRGTVPTAFAKEHWILKDWKSLSGVLGAGAPI